MGKKGLDQNISSNFSLKSSIWNSSKTVFSHGFLAFCFYRLNFKQNSYLYATTDGILQPRKQ